MGEVQRAREFRFLVTVVSWTALLGALVVLIVAVVVPRLAGATPYTVLTGSMEPTYPPGTLVVVRPVDTSAIRPGDVVTIQLRSGEPEVVTHRVVGVLVGRDGSPRWRTQGDANDVADQDLRIAEQVRGRVWYSVPHLGRASNVLSGSTRNTLTLVMAGALAVYALAMFTSAIADRRRRRPPTTPQDETREAGAHRS